MVSALSEALSFKRKKTPSAIEQIAIKKITAFIRDFLLRRSLANIIYCTAPTSFTTNPSSE